LNSSVPQSERDRGKGGRTKLWGRREIEPSGPLIAKKADMQTIDRKEDALGEKGKDEWKETKEERTS